MENEENKEQEQTQESPEATSTELVASEPAGEVGTPEGTGSGPDTGEATSTDPVGESEKVA